MSDSSSAGAVPERNRQRAAGADLILPLLAAVYGVYYLWTIRDFPWEARINGTFIALVLWALVAVLLVRTWVRIRGGEESLRLAETLPPRSQRLQRAGFIALTVADIALVPLTGFTLSVWLFMLFSMLLLGVRERRILILLPPLVALIGYGFFIRLLDTRLPFGPLEWFLGRIV